MIQHLSCVACGQTYQPTKGLYTCPTCGIAGILDVVYDYDQAAAELTRAALAANPERSLWRYLPLLPVAGSGIQPLQVGWTPLVRSPRLNQALGMPHLLIKEEGRNPTGSFKDRSSALGVARALEEGEQVITCASTGNAASSLAGFCASAGLASYIFVPTTAPEAKVAQLLIYGAQVLLVEGTYDEAYYLCNEAAERFGWYNRNCAINPYLMEGKKTVSFEIAEQLNWEVPDWVIMAVGDGCSIAGAYKGFAELHRIGLIDRLPRFLGVQATGSAPMVGLYESGTLQPVIPATQADSIAVGEPRNSVKALRGIRESGGSMLRVADEQILQGMQLLAAHSGIFAEPAGSAAFAGLLQARESGLIGATERVVVVATGNGLKDIRSAMQVTQAPARIPPTLEAVANAIGHR